MEPFIAIWTILVSIIGLNGFAGGVAAVLHTRRDKKRRRTRILTAAAMAGLLPACVMILPMLEAVSIGAEAPIALVIGVGGVFLMTMAVSLPGAIVVARRLEAPGEEYQAFE
jgi:hypothetical protein